MILGYVDGNDRVYDLNFATLKLRLRLEGSGGTTQILFSQPTGTGEVAYRVLAEAEATASAAMDHAGHPVPLLRPVPGRLHRHEAGVLFLAEPRVRDPEDPGFFLVKTRAMLSAVKFFFEEQGGRELISIPQDEILRVQPGAEAERIFVSAANIALPKEQIAYAVDFSPRARVAKLLDGLPMSERT